MSAVEDSIKTKDVPKSKGVPLLNRALDFLSSVRFGVVLLCILVFLSMLGMLIIQQNVQGFDTAYALKTPAERYLYGLLGLFDIYGSWYYNGLLLLLSLNIVLASIDRMPGAWKYISEPKLTATRGWLLSQPQHAVETMRAASESELAERIAAAFAKAGFKPRTKEETSSSYAVGADGKKDFTRTETTRSVFVFGQSGQWNRMGAYVVHVFLLILFLGHFVANKTGFDADIRLTPEVNAALQRDFSVVQKTDSIQRIDTVLDRQERYNLQLPFTIACTEIEQQLIDPKGSIEITNTIDWRTRIVIDDPQYGQTTADVSLNRPYSYRGYRFFQASAITMGSAKKMKLELRPAAGGEPLTVDLERGGKTTLPDGTSIAYSTFVPDFTMNGGQPASRSGDYNNPAVVLDVTPAGGGEAQRVFAFANKIPDNAPIAQPKAGYRWHLASFEKSPLAHVLSIKYDPFSAGFIAWYVGGFGLIGALVFVFFISHRRIWAKIEPRGDGVYEVVFAGQTNRNHLAFGDKFKTVVSSLTSNGSRA